MQSAKTLRIGVAGGTGTVGSGVVAGLRSMKPNAEEPLLRVAKIVGRDPKKNVLNLPFSTDPSSIIKDPSIDIAVELMGGKVGERFIGAALRSGKHVVTANKMAIDRRKLEFDELAHGKGLFLGFEASVCGAIPIINAIERHRGNNTHTIVGIVNGTTNYILTAMERGATYDRALKKAQKLGFAEADPSFDVGGKDAAQKIAILASLNFGLNITSDSVETSGITSITPEDIRFASQLGDSGYVIKLLAIAKLDRDRSLQLSVNPMLVPRDNHLALVGGGENAVTLYGNSPLFFSGLGAGKEPTAGAVISDIQNIAASVVNGVRPIRHFTDGWMPDINGSPGMSRFYLRFDALDVPGSLAELASRLARQEVSVAELKQPGERKNDRAPIVLLTHEADPGRVRRAVSNLRKLEMKQMLMVHERLE